MTDKCETSRALSSVGFQGAWGGVGTIWAGPGHRWAGFAGRRGLGWAWLWRGGEGRAGDLNFLPAQSVSAGK